MTRTKNGTRNHVRTLAILSTAVAAFGLTSPQRAVAQAFTYTGPSGSSAAPNTGNWSPAANWLGGSAPTASTTTELDFLDSTSSGYIATDDISSGFLLNGLVLGNNTSNADTLAASGSSSLSFNGTSPYVTQNGSGTFVIIAPIGINPSVTLTFGGTGTGTVIVSGSIGGGAGNAVIQAGANTLVLSGSNSFAGAISANSGILNIQNSSAISGPQAYVNTGATLQLQNNITESAALQINGNGYTGQDGAVVNVSGTNTISGNVTSAGAETISSDGGTLIFSGANFTDYNNLTLSGPAAGVLAESSLTLRNVTKNGTGTWYFNTPGFTDPSSLNLNSGTINFVQGGLSVSYINANGGVLQYAANTPSPDDISQDILYGSGTIEVDTNGNNVTWAGNLSSNSSGLTKYGSGTLTLTAALAYSGGQTTIAGGTLQFGNSSTGQLPNGESISILGGAAMGVDLGTSTPMYNTITNAGTLYGDQGSGLTNQLAGTISGGGVVIENGSGTLILSGNNNYTGTTTVSSGTLQAGNANAFGTLSDVTLANAANTALNITGWNITLGSLAGGGTLGGNVVLGSNNLTVGGDNASTTYAGVISGTGALYKTGSGTFTLTGSSSFTGGGNVSGGILNIQNSDALGTGTSQTFAVFQNTTLQLQGGITLPGYTVQVADIGDTGQDGAIVNVGGSNTIPGQINVAGTGAGTTAISSDSGTLTIDDLNSGGNSLIFAGAGNGVISQSALTLHDVTKNGSGAWYFNTPGFSDTSSLHLNAGTINFVQGGLGVGGTQVFINANGGVLQYAANTTSPDDLSARLAYGSGPVAVHTNGNNVTWASNLSNNNDGLTKYGSGTLTLLGAMAYKGGQTAVAGGTLQFGNGSAGLLPSSGSNPVSIASGAAMGVDEGSSTPMYNTITNAGTLYGDQGSGLTNQLAGTISGGGVVIENGSGTLILSGNNTYTGATTISSGTLQAASSTAIGSLSDVTLANAANTALNINGWNITLGSLAGGGTLGGNVVLGPNNLTVGGDGASTTYSGAISGTGDLYKTGSGMFTLTGSSSFTGGGNVSGGILNIQNSDALGTGTSQTFAVYQNTTLQLQGGITLPGYTVQVADIGDTGQDGAIVNLSGNNTITGLVNVTGVNAGTTTIAADSGTLIIAGGMITGGNNVIITGAGNGVFSSTTPVNFTNSNFIEKDGFGLWDFANGSAAFAGNLHLNSGTVSFVSGGLGTTTINANGGVLKYDTGNTQDVSDVAGSPVIQYGGGAPIAIDTNGNNVTFAGGLSNNTTATGLTKYGSGTLTLSVPTVYPGITTVDGGALDITGSLANSTTIIVNAATLILDGAGAVPSSTAVTATTDAAVPTVTLNANQTFTSLTNAGYTNINAGSTTIGTIANTGTTTVASAATLNATSAFSEATVNNSGIVNINGGATNIIGQGNGIGTGAGGSLTTGGISGAGTLNVTGGNLTASVIQQGVLNINSGATVTIADSTLPAPVNGNVSGNTAATSVLTDLNFDGASFTPSTTATLDLKNNDLIVNDPAQHTALVSAIANAYNGASWNGAGITSSSAAANPSEYGLGYATGAELGTTSFDGQPISAGSTVIKYTLLGDTTLKGSVTGVDYSTVVANFDKPAQDWAQGNFFNATGAGPSVTGVDYSTVVANFDRSVSGNLAQAQPALARSALSASPATNGSANDLHLEVNTVTGDVQLLAINNMTLSFYNISDSSSNLRTGQWKQINANAAVGSAGVTYTAANWAVAGNNNYGVGEGQNNGKYKSTVASTYDNITLTAGQSIDLGTVFKVTSDIKDLGFEFQEPNGTTGDPVQAFQEFAAGTTTVDYIGAPEPATLGLLGLGGVMMMRRRRRAARAC